MRRAGIPKGQSYVFYYPAGITYLVTFTDGNIRKAR